MEHHVRVSINTPRYGSVNPSQFTLFEKGEADLKHRVVILTLIHWLGSPFFYRNDPNRQ